MKIKTFEQINENIDFNNIIYVLRSDDWDGVYINNNLIMEGHSIDLSKFINKLIELGIDFKNKTYDNKYIEGDKSENFFELSDYRCPETLEEVFKNYEKVGIN